MADVDSSAIRVDIRRDGKPTKSGVLSVLATGHIQVLKDGFLPRVVLTRDPAKFETRVDHDDSAIVIDGRRYAVEEGDLSKAVALIALASDRRSGTSVATARRQAQSTAATDQGPKSPTKAHSLAVWSEWLIVLSFLLGALGIAGGLILALQTENVGFNDQERPYFAAGIGIALNAAFFAVVGVVLGKVGEIVATSNTDAEGTSAGPT